MTESLSDDPSRQGIGGFRRNSQWLTQLSMRWDLLNYHWSRWVLNYDSRLQNLWMERWLGGTDPWRIALAVIGTGGLLVALMLADRKSTRLNSSHVAISYAVFCL